MGEASLICETAKLIFMEVLRNRFIYLTLSNSSIDLHKTDWTEDASQAGCRVGVYMYFVLCLVQFYIQILELSSLWELFEVLVSFIAC